MKVKRVVIKNFCQHKDKELDIKPGLSVLAGVNGAGKSNLIRAIFFGLTGEILGAGRKTDMLSWGADKGYVEVEILDAAQNLLTVRRNLHNSTNKLTYANGDSLTKKADVNEVISQMIGLDVKMLSQLAFVGQGKLTEILTMDHSERARLITRMCGLDKAEKLRDLLLKAKGRVAQAPSQQQAIEEYKAKLTEIKESADAVEQQHTEVRFDLDQLTPGIASMQAALSAPRKEEVVAELQKTSEELSALDTEIQSTKEQLADMMEEVVPLTEDEQQSIVAWDNAQAVQQQAKGYIEQLKLLSQPVAPDCRYREDIQQELADCTQECYSLLKRLELIKEGKCDKCGSEFKVSAKEQAALTEQYAQLSRDMEGLKEELARADEAQAAYRSQLATFDSQKQSLLSNLEYAREQFRKKPDLTEAEIDALRDRQARFNEYAKSLQQRTSLQDHLLNSQTRMGILEERETALKQKLETAVTVEVQSKAREGLALVQQLQAREQSMSTEIAVLKNSMKHIEEAIAKAEAQEAAAKAARETVEIMDTARDILHPDVLPRAALAVFRKKANAGILRYGQIFDLPFIVELNEEFDFTVSFPDQAGLAVTTLSGGQQVAAALAVRLALADILTDGCGVLVLDEPTAYLDERNIQVLMEVLSRTAAHMKAAGVSILVPTHEPVMLQVADSRIEI